MAKKEKEDRTAADGLSQTRLTEILFEWSSSLTKLEKDNQMLHTRISDMVRRFGG